MAVCRLSTAVAPTLCCGPATRSQGMHGHRTRTTDAGTMTTFCCHWACVTTNLNKRQLELRHPTQRYALRMATHWQTPTCSNSTATAPSTYRGGRRPRLLLKATRSWLGNRIAAPALYGPATASAILLPQVKQCLPEWLISSRALWAAVW